MYENCTDDELAEMYTQLSHKAQLKRREYYQAKHELIQMNEEKDEIKTEILARRIERRDAQDLERQLRF